jgi:hypothetical protein
MSAHLTVYTMAVAAERPVRMWEAEQASRIALAEASSGRGTDPLLRRLGSALRHSWRHSVAAGHGMGTRGAGCTAVHQLAS